MENSEEMTCDEQMTPRVRERARKNKRVKCGRWWRREREKEGNTEGGEKDGDREKRLRERGSETYENRE